MGFALSHSTMRARGTREDPSAGHIRALAVEPHEHNRGHRLWTGAEPPDPQADRLSVCDAGYAATSALRCTALWGL